MRAGLVAFGTAQPSCAAPAPRIVLIPVITAERVCEGGDGFVGCLHALGHGREAVILAMGDLVLGSPS